jgi:phospholipid transport system substrate-binding protein
MEDSAMTPGKTLQAILVAALALGWSLGGAARAASADPSNEAAALIETLGQRVLALQGLEAAGRPAPLQDLIRGGFDLDLTSQLVLGKFWGRATARQRGDFKDLFAEYLLNTYAHHLDSYRVDTLAVLASKPTGKRDFLVETSIERESGVASAVWRVRALDGGYRIIDVFIDGISLVLTHRSEFASIIRTEGLDGMLGALREKVAAQAAAPDRTSRAAFRASLLFSPSAYKTKLLRPQN